ncbi:type II secretory pathway protein [Pseudoalteromonas sp. J010]|uniref:type II secretory pathway protein n=1 Tax=Pseudoalteromonas sp. J010 TaxID=998465 RepID=UPI0016399A57|nr:type II secretory pathway protein [Pseudoalteromonas sp. J010]
MKRFFVSLFVCLFVSSALFASEQNKPIQLRNAPISELTQWLSLVTGKSIVVSSSASGTLLTADIPSVSTVDLMVLLDHIAKSNNLVMLDYGDVVRIENNTNQLITVGALESVVYKFSNIQATKVLPLFQQAIKTPDTDKKFMEKFDDIKFQTPSASMLPNSNSILAITSPEVHEQLSGLRGALDSPIRQVLIEAIIIETDAGDGSSFGVDLSTALKQTGFTFTSNTLGSLSSGLGANYMYSSGGDIRALISATAKVKNTKILSTPTLLVMDREQGAISVGQNVPFLIAKEVTDAGKSITRIERKNVGVSLSVIPHILEDGTAILKINQESSSVTDSTTASDIVTNQRSIQTTVSVKNGQTIVLGGLVSEENRKSEDGVPVLKDVPVLGYLFKTESNNVVQRELTVMLKVLVF